MTDPIFSFHADGQKPSLRNLFDTDTLLRRALGDNAKTTARLMELANGARSQIVFTFRGVTVTVKKDETK